MATKQRASKSSTSKKKPTARQAAAARMSAQGAKPDERRVPRSTAQVSQGRFPGETPLTGEDRPLDTRGDKQQGYRQDLQPDRGDVKIDCGNWHGAPPKKRRADKPASK